MKMTKMLILLFLMAIIAVQINPIDAAGSKIVTDMRGAKVSIPEDPQRVVAMSRSLIDTTMYIFGEQDKLVGGSIYQKGGGYENYTYDGEDHRVCTWISFVLNPNYRNLTNVGGFGGPYGTPNVENIASLNPDLLILRDLGTDDEDTAKFLEALKRLNIPVVVLKYPDCYDNVSVDTIYEEVRLLGEVFGKQEKAEKIVSLMDKQVQLIKDRTDDIVDEDKAQVLYFGAPTSAKDKGGAGYALGTHTIESIFLEDIVNAKNAYNESTTDIISSERLLSIDPDVIILPTYSGHHPPREMYDEERFKNVQDLSALKNKRVYSLAATPCRDERLEFPINLMIEAKAVYPDRFKDIDLDNWIRDYFKDLYGVDDDKAAELMNSLLLRYLEIV